MRRPKTRGHKRPPINNILTIKSYVESKKTLKKRRVKMSGTDGSGLGGAFFSADSVDDPRLLTMDDSIAGRECSLDSASEQSPYCRAPKPRTKSGACVAWMPFRITAMRGATWLVLLTQGALMVSAGMRHAGSGTCERRVASLEREIVRLSEQLSLCPRVNPSMTAPNASGAPVSDEPTTRRSLRRNRHAAARRLQQQANAGRFALGQVDLFL